MDFGGLISKQSSKIKNGYVLETVKGDFINDWREFDNSIKELAKEYARTNRKSRKCLQKLTVQGRERIFYIYKKRLDQVKQLDLIKKEKNNENNNLYGNNFDATVTVCNYLFIRCWNRVQWKM